MIARENDEKRELITISNLATSTKDPKRKGQFLQTYEEQNLTCPKNDRTNKMNQNYYILVESNKYIQR